MKSPTPSLQETQSAGPSGPRSQSKKRRIPGACDNCKKKKIRCDSAEMIGNRCSNCIQFSLECTHQVVSKTLGSAKGYVESLENRLEKMEKLVNKLLPGVDLNQELDKLDQGSATPPELPGLPRNDDDIREEELVGRLKRLHVDPPRGRFFGKSSGYQLVQTALDIRSEYFGKDKKFDHSVFGVQRGDYYLSPPWHPSRLEVPKLPSYFFPDDDLLPSLVDAYFIQINYFLPLLHRPSFEISVADGLHHRDKSFGGTVLLVCALGSRYSDDPRVLYPGTNEVHSAGWKWFEQVPVNRESFNEAPSLYDLQCHSLSVLFSQSTECPQGCWTQLGMALRMAQEVGAHRRRTLKAPTAEDEQWKRVFWVLMSLDRLISSFSGRQSVLREDDYDVELPIECDDEYWSQPDPSLNFQQPAGQPSTITYFNCYIKLLDILIQAMRAVYSVKRTGGSRNGAPYLDQKVIIDLDSALNHWVDSVPDHLRWNPSCDNKLFLKQSATLYATYYHLQIFIHRPFIPSFRNPTPTTFPSLAICTNAARSCCHVLEVQRRNSELPLPSLQITIFTAAVVLLVNIWSGKKSGVAPSPHREMEDLQRCLNLLTACERTWCSAGRFRDGLMELAGDLSLSLSSRTDSPTNNKRPRETDSPPAPQVDSWLNKIMGKPRAVVGSRRVSKEASSVHGRSASLSQPVNFALPMYGDELGRLPVYGQFNFSESSKRPRHEPKESHPGIIPTASAPVPVESHGPTSSHEEFGLLDNTDFSQSSLAMLSDSQPQNWDMFNAYQAPQITVADNTVETSIFVGQLDQLLASSGDPVPVLDNDALATCSRAPTGFELNEWGTYISNVDEMTQRLPWPDPFPYH